MKLKMTTLGGVMLVALMAAVTVVAVVAVQTNRSVHAMELAWTDFETQASREIVLLQRLNAALGYGGMIHQFKNYVLRLEPKRRDKVLARMGEAQAAIKTYRALAKSTLQHQALDGIESVVVKYRAAVDTTTRMIAAGQSSAAIDRVVKIDDGPALEGLKVLTEAYIKGEEASKERILNAGAQAQSLSSSGGLLVTILLVSVIVLLGVVLFFRIIRPIRAMTMAMDSLARGDLSVAIPGGTRTDEIGDMANAVEVFRDNAERVRALEKSARALVGSIAIIASQVKESVAAQASAANEQAASVAQTSSSLEEIRETASHTQDRAKSLSVSAERTLSEGQTSVSSMADGVAAIQSIRDRVEAIATTMVTLSEQNRRVGEITASVNNLAQQSKMLAINASIEAAKAGEAGKGFAVVAEEMGNLAEQSEEATSQVRGVLDEIQGATERAVLATEEGTKQVDVGVRLIQTAGEGVGSLNRVIGDTVTETNRIVDAVRQQTGGVQQVAAAVGDINKTTRHFATTVSQIQQAMESLVAEVDKLTRAGQARGTGE